VDDLRGQITYRVGICRPPARLSIEHDRHFRAVADLGQKWVEVSKRVGRMSVDCRDRYRNHLAQQGVRKTGECLHHRYETF
jgi:hypothetical protein